MIDRSNFPDFNDNLVILWEKTFDEFPKVADRIYQVHRTDVDTGSLSSIDGFGFARRKNESQDHAIGDPAQFYRSNWHTYEVSLEAKISWNMRRYDKYDKINEEITGLAESVAMRMELDKTHRLTFSNATSYTDMDGVSVNVTTGDGLSLISTAHTVPKSSTTFRNRVSGDPLLSQGGLEAAENLFSTQMITSNGTLAVKSATAIIIGKDANTRNTAMKYLKSYADPEGNNSGVINPYEGSYELIQLPFLATTAAGAYDSTKAHWWFLADLNRKGLHAFVGQDPTFVSPEVMDGKVPENYDWIYSAFASYALVCNDPRWIVGSFPS